MEHLAISPNGKTLGVSSYDKTVRFWNIQNGERLQTLTFPDTPFGIVFSPNGNLLAVGFKNGTIQLLDTFNGRVIQTLRGHTGLINSVVFSPDGTKLASSSFDGLIILWDIAKSKEIQLFDGHSNSVWQIAISPDGNTLASASTDGTVRLWNVDSGREILTLQDNTVLREWYDVEFSVEGKLLAAASQHISSIREVISGCELRTIDSPQTGIDTISFSPDGKLLAMGGDGVVQLWGVP